ncbi:MAG: peptidylprolyl isomerase [Polyangiales bacterium]
MLRRRALALAALLSLPLAAVAQPRDAAPAAPADPAETARRAAVVARVGDATITVGELEDMLNEAPAPIRQTYLTPERRREYLEQVVTTMLLAREARARGIDRTPEVAAALRRILAQRVEQALVLEAISPESISRDEVERYYQSHLDDYQQPEFRRATVAITADRAAAQRVIDGARSARGDLRRVRALVRENSVDEATRAHEGDAFYFRRDGSPSDAAHGRPVPAPLAAAVFALNREMDVTPQPVALPDGRFGVGVLTGIRPALDRHLGDPGVEASIRGFLVRERRQQRSAEVLAQARERLHPETHPERLDLIHLPPSDLGDLPPFDPRNAPHGH